MMWVLDIFGEHAHPYVIRLWLKFQLNLDHGFRDMDVLP
jgi:hypothetical protein